MPVIYREAWFEDQGRDELDVLGDDEAALGDELDAGSPLIVVLVGDSVQLILSSSQVTASISRARSREVTVRAVVSL